MPRVPLSTMTGAELRAIRESLGMRQVDFAAMLGIRAENLSRKENGRQAITAQVAARARRVTKERSE